MGKNDFSKQRCGDETTTKSYSSGVDGMKEHIFDCVGYKDAAKFNETQNELSNYILQSSEKGRLDVVNVIRDLKTKDTTPTAPTKTEKALRRMCGWATIKPRSDEHRCSWMGASACISSP